MLCNRGHNDCVLFLTRIYILCEFGIREMPCANYRVAVGLFLLVSLRKRSGVFANETYRISGVDGIKWQAYNNRKGRKILRAIFTYKRIKRKKTKTYGLVSSP